MKTVITKITVESEAPAELLTEEFMKEYEEAAYELIKSETDEGAKIEVSVEIR